MPAKLNYIIPASNFETIRDAIASLLKIEMDNQAVLRGSGLPVVPNPDYTADFYTERFSPVDKGEGNVIIVSIAGGDLNNRTPVSQVFGCSFNIDCFVSAKENSSNTGYYNSAVKIHRLAGLARHILQSPYYDRLGLSNGIVQMRSVSSILFAPVSDEQDSAFVRMGRIKLDVNVYESSNEQDVVTAAGYDTIIKIDETEKGFKLTYNNE